MSGPGEKKKGFSTAYSGESSNQATNRTATQRAEQTVFCQNCGKSISAHDRFCNYCGTPVSRVQTPAVQSPAQQTRKAGNTGKNKVGKRILSALIAVGVHFLAVTVADYATTKSNEAPYPTQTSSAVFTEAEDNSLSTAMSNCLYGGLYENGYLRFGFARLSLPNYELSKPEEDDVHDYLISSDGCCLLGVWQMIETGISYDSLNEDYILKSTLQDYPDASIIDFQKYKMNGAYVIRYISQYTDEEVALYLGELILLPGKTSTGAIRLYMLQEVSTGYDKINQAFDTLSISADYAPSRLETNALGSTHIVVK